MIPAIIGAGASLLGGLFQSSSQRSAERRAQENRINEFADLRTAAERGNVNFLTALSAGGLRQSVPVFTSPFGQTLAQVGGLLADGYARRSAQQAEDRDRAASAAAQRQQVRAVERAAVTSPAALTEDYTQFVDAVSSPPARGIQVHMPTGHVAQVNRFALPAEMREAVQNRLMTQAEYAQIFGFESAETLSSQNPGRISRATGVPSPAQQFDATQTDYRGLYERTIQPAASIGSEAARLDRSIGTRLERAVEDASRALNPFTRMREAMFGRR